MSSEKKEMDKMLQVGVIEPTCCEWGSPIVLAMERDGTLRFCVDYRNLNSITIKDVYQIQRIEEYVDCL